MKTFAIITAAGSGLRFGAMKQFQLLQGRPILLHTLAVFEASSVIHGICITVPESEVATTQKLVHEAGFKKVLGVITGGKERQDSVRKGFEFLPPCDLIMVHDGVRPLVTPDILSLSTITAVEYGTCVVGWPVKETIKKVDTEKFVQETVDRSSLWSIQTPQTFRYDIFHRAVTKAVQENFLGTDESMLVERLGEKVKVIPGSPENIKITTPEDLVIAETILKTRRTPCE